MYRTFEGANTTVIHSDAVEVLDRDVADGSVDLIFADPPYNIGKRFSQFLDNWPSNAERLKAAWSQHIRARCLGNRRWNSAAASNYFFAKVASAQAAAPSADASSPNFVATIS